ncbi:MAG: hypothetical protein KA105_04065 [Caulobacter sp.]|nr:hypothetical protein [Caulobacter sp.]
MLPWRTEKAIELKAARLGLTRTGKVWLDGQWDYAKPLYRRGEDVRAMIAPAVLKAPRQVWAKASKAGVRRPRKPPKPTSWPLLNQVRERAHILKLSMADLDALAETGSYFSAPRRLNLRAISRALKVLGGRFDVEWRDVQDGSLDT